MRHAPIPPRRTRRLFAAFLLAGASSLPLAACNLAPDYRPPHIDAPSSFKEAMAGMDTSAWQPARPADDVGRGAWWQAFGDPVLDDLETQVEAANPTLAVAVARHDRARAAASAAAGALAPNAGLDASITRNRQSDDRPLRGTGQQSAVYGANTWGVEAGYELDFWGRIRNSVAAGQAQAQASAADLADARLSLQAELARDYVDLRGVDGRLAILNETVAAYEKAVELTRTLFKGDIASGMDVSRAQSQLESVRSQAADLEATRATLEHAVAILVGKAPAEFSLAPVKWSLHPVPAPMTLPAALLQRRPDVAAAERRVAAANAGIGVARAAYYPAITLGAQAGFQDTGFQLMSLPMAMWSAGPSLSLPLFEGGRLDANLAGAQAGYREAVAEYRATVLESFREVEDGLAQVRWLGKAATAGGAGAKAARQTLDMAMNLYRDGADSYLDVVTAQTALLQAEQQTMLLEARQVQADVALIRALGGGWRVDDLPQDPAFMTAKPSTTAQAAP